MRFLLALCSFHTSERTKTRAKEGAKTTQLLDVNISLVKCDFQTPTIWKRVALVFTAGAVNTVFWGTIGIDVHLSSPFLFGLEERKGLKLHKMVIVFLFCAGDTIVNDKRAL